MNKKGGEKLLSLWWFFVLGVIAGGIVIAVMIYSAADVSVKELEADILGERILDCIIKEGYLIDFDESDILTECDLDEKMFTKGSDFYFEIGVFKEGNLVEEVIKKGSSAFEKECSISMSDVDAKHFPDCILQKENILDEKGERLEIKLLTASNQKGEKRIFK